MSQHSYYTRHPHYPDVKLNTRMPQMTGSTLSTSNMSANNEGGNQMIGLRELSETNSAVEEPNSHFTIQTQKRRQEQITMGRASSPSGYLEQDTYQTDALNNNPCQAAVDSLNLG